MPVETLTFPKDIVVAARAYAAREEKSIVELFTDWLKQSFGFCRVNVVDHATHRHEMMDGLDPRVQALYGSLRLPPEFEGKSDDEFKDEYFKEKYGVFKCQ